MLTRKISLILLVPALLAVFPLDVCADESTDKELERMVNVWKRKRLIMDIEPGSNDVSVNPTHWKSLSYSQQESTSKALAMYCSSKQGNPIIGQGWVEIKDGVSGRRLAKYGSWGFQQEE